MSNYETLKIKHITNMLGNERRTISYIFTRFGKQEEVVSGKLKASSKTRLLVLALNQSHIKCSETASG